MVKNNQKNNKPKHKDKNGLTYNDSYCKLDLDWTQIAISSE